MKGLKRERIAMNTQNHNQALPNAPLALMLTSILPFLAIITPGVLQAGDVKNTATVSAAAGSVDRDETNNTATVITNVLATIVANDDAAGGINGRTGATDVLNVFGNDTLDGTVASVSNATLALAPGETLPAGIAFDPATGSVGVAPGTSEGRYTFDYEICEEGAPTNCEIATVTLDVITAVAEIGGTVFLDLDSDGQLDPQEPLLSGWTVEVLTGGNIVDTVITAADGSYAFPGLPGGTEYTIRFRDPDTGVVFEQVTGINLEDGQTLPDQNLPIDPSGIIYDSLTRSPVTGATATLVDRSGNPLPADCYIDASQSNQVTGPSGAYRFDLVPGAAAACPLGETEYSFRILPPTGFSFTSTILPPQIDALDPTGQGSPVRISPTLTVPSGADVVYFLTFELAAGDPDVINNHIPLDPFLSRDGLVVTKTSSLRSASTGDLVPYQITVRNDEAFRRAGVNVVDVLPSGMTYVEGTSRVNGLAAEPVFENGNRELNWPGQIIPANGMLTVDLVLVVGAGVTQGQALNTGLAENAAGETISNRGTAAISIVPSTVFDCSELIGQVYEDYNRNGYQDDGEPGVPAARVVTVNGELITTDEYGRYHIACAAVPDARIGSNFVLRLDEESIPQGYTVTTDNPRSVRLTRGKLGEIDFGIAEADVVALNLTASDFAGDGSLRPEALARIAALANQEEINLIIRATYAIQNGDSEAVLAERLGTIRDALRSAFSSGWDGPDPVIQVNAANNTIAEGGE